MSSSQCVQIFREMTELAVSSGAVNLSQGLPEPLFDTNLRDALIASSCGHWQYTSPSGGLSLRETIEAYYQNSFDASNEITITSGCTESVLIALIALRQTGREKIITPEPYYPYYPGFARLSGCSLTSCKLQLDADRATLDFYKIEQGLQFGAKIILLNTPHNPTGMVLSVNDWEIVADLAENYDAIVILDDVYREFNYTTSPTPTPWVKLINSNRLIIAGAVSKMFAATGMRAGWLLAPQEYTTIALDAHMHMSYCASEVIQSTVHRLFKCTELAVFEAYRCRYIKKRDHLLAALRLFGFRCLYPEGGHFISATYEMSQFAKNNSLDFCRILTKNVGITPLPMDSFFSENPQPFIRFSFAVTNEQIEEACQRLAKSSLEEIE